MRIEIGRPAWWPPKPDEGKVERRRRGTLSRACRRWLDTQSEIDEELASRVENNVKACKQVLRIAIAQRVPLVVANLLEVCESPASQTNRPPYLHISACVVDHRCEIEGCQTRGASR